MLAHCGGDTNGYVSAMCLKTQKFTVSHLHNECKDYECGEPIDAPYILNFKEGSVPKRPEQ